MRFGVSLLALCFALAGIPAAAQSVPNANYSDMWWNPGESGWGVTLVQHSSDRVYAIWYTYDPRVPEPGTTNPRDFKPLWIVMNGGTWTAPNTLTGDVFVTDGSPYYASWRPDAHRLTRVGTFTFVFSDAARGTFSYNIAAPAGIGPDDPAYGLPSIAGSKPIQRQSF